MWQVYFSLSSLALSLLSLSSRCLSLSSLSSLSLVSLSLSTLCVSLCLCVCSEEGGRGLSLRRRVRNERSRSTDVLIHPHLAVDSGLSFPPLSTRVRSGLVRLGSVRLSSAQLRFGPGVVVNPTYLVLCANHKHVLLSSCSFFTCIPFN